MAERSVHPAGWESRRLGRDRPPTRSRARLAARTPSGPPCTHAIHALLRFGSHPRVEPAATCCSSSIPLGSSCGAAATRSSCVPRPRACLCSSFGMRGAWSRPPRSAKRCGAIKSWVGATACTVAFATCAARSATTLAVRDSSKPSHDGGTDSWASAPRSSTPLRRPGRRAGGGISFATAESCSRRGSRAPFSYRSSS